MLKIERFTAENKDLYKKSFHIREKVFIDEQRIDPEIEQDDYEQTSVYYLVFKKVLPLATARWRETSEGIKIERFATLKEFRNHSIGTQLLKRMLKDIVPLKQTVYLHAQKTSVRFYQKHGFQLQCEKFEEAGIEHYKMVYNAKKKK